MTVRIFLTILSLAYLAAAPATARASDPSLEEVQRILGANPDSRNSFAASISHGECWEGVGCFNMWERYCRAEPPSAPSSCAVEACLGQIPRVAQWEADCSSTPNGVSPPFGSGIRIRRHASGATERLLLALRGTLDEKSREVVRCQQGTSDRCVVIHDSSFDEYMGTLNSLASSPMLTLISPSFVAAVQAEATRGRTVASRVERDCDAKVAQLEVTNVVFEQDPACGNHALPLTAVARLRSAYGHAYRRHVELGQVAAFSASLDRMETVDLPNTWARTYELLLTYERLGTDVTAYPTVEALDEFIALLTRVNAFGDRVEAHASTMARAECDAQLSNVESIVHAAMTFAELRPAEDVMRSLNERMASELAPAMSATDWAAVSARLGLLRRTLEDANRRIETAERAGASARWVESRRVYCEAHGLAPARQRAISHEVARVLADPGRARQIASQMPMNCMEGFPGVALQCAVISFRLVQFSADEAQPYLTCLEGRTPPN